MQPRFDKRVGSGPHGLVEQARFRAGFDFMRLRAEVGEIEMELADWWEDFSLGSDEEREALLAQVRPAPRRVPKAAAPRPEARTAAAKTGAESTESPEGHLAEGAHDPAAPKKRRRRRKPASARGDAAPGSQKGLSNASSEGSSGSAD
jgi:poly(A) polymerase